MLLLISGTGAARAVPVVPNFTQGSMTSHTETTSTVTETINSMDYNTGWQYVVTGTNVESDGSLVPTGAGSINATQVTLDVGAYDMNTSGSAFSFSESWTQGDVVNAIGSGPDVTSGVVADLPAYGEVLTMSGGVAGDLAGTITSAGVTTLTAGGAGTTATGQFVTEIVID